MKKSVFQKKYSSDYPKARSLISGNINAKEPKPQIIKDTLAEYKRSKCIYQSFRHERIHQEIGKRLSVQDVFAAFRTPVCIAL